MDDLLNITLKREKVKKEFKSNLIIYLSSFCITETSSMHKNLNSFFRKTFSTCFFELLSCFF